MRYVKYLLGLKGMSNTKLANELNRLIDNWNEYNHIPEGSTNKKGVLVERELITRFLIMFGVKDE